jgi:putative Holliday junction resolvase
MRYLGIDYGSKRVGIALSDERGMMAFPSIVVPNNMQLIAVTSALCKAEGITAIVIGESHDLSGTPNKIMGSIEEFKRNLEAELDLPIYFQAEFMTTIHARGLPAQVGRAGKESNNARKVAKDISGPADASAAALILQRYLDKKNQQ